MLTLLFRPGCPHHHHGHRQNQRIYEFENKIGRQIRWQDI